MSLKLHKASRGTARWRVLVSERRGVVTLTYAASTRQTRSHVQAGRREQWGSSSSGHSHRQAMGRARCWEPLLAAWCRQSSGVLGPEVMAGSHSGAAGGGGAGQAWADLGGILVCRCDCPLVCEGQPTAVPPQALCGTPCGKCSADTWRLVVCCVPLHCLLSGLPPPAPAWAGPKALPLGPPPTLLPCPGPTHKHGQPSASSLPPSLPPLFKQAVPSPPCAGVALPSPCAHRLPLALPSACPCCSLPSAQTQSGAS